MSSLRRRRRQKAAVYRLFRSSLCGDGELLSVGQVAEVKGHVQLAVYQLHVSRADDTVQINDVYLCHICSNRQSSEGHRENEEMMSNTKTEDGDRD